MVKYALSGDESAVRSTLKFKKRDEIESKNSLFTVMAPEPKRKPRPQPATYNRQKEKQGKKDAPTSAKPSMTI